MIWIFVEVLKKVDMVDLIFLEGTFEFDFWDDYSEPDIWFSSATNFATVHIYCIFWLDVAWLVYLMHTRTRVSDSLDVV